jgi:glycosyltransferase involved in cell wall biosynthesis
MKVIFITREGYNLAGARKRCYEFAREIKKQGIDSEVLSFSDHLGAKDGVEETGMRFRDKLIFNCKAFNKIIKQKESFLYMQRFNYHSFAPYLANLINKNKLILDLDDWEMRENIKFYFNFFPSSKAYCFVERIARKSIFCVAASRFLETFLKKFNKRVFYIPSGVDTEVFKPSLANFESEKIVLSWTGTFNKLEYVENIDFVLQCFVLLRKRFKSIFCDIVGDGIYRNSIVQMISRFGDPNICLKNWIPPDGVAGYLNNINIGLFPVARDTNFNRAKSPTKLFEYMSMAKPTVSSSFWETNEIVRDGTNGFLAKNKEDFIEKTQALIENPRLCRTMGENARQSIKENFSLEVLGRKLSEAFRT